MNKIILGIAIFLLFILTSTGLAQALSPSAMVRECSQNINAHYECKKILCEWGNISNNWPTNTGYYQNCEEVGYSYFNYDLGVFLGIIGMMGIIATIFLLRSSNKKRVYMFLGICILIFVIINLVLSFLFTGKIFILPVNVYTGLLGLGVQYY